MKRHKPTILSVFTAYRLLCRRGGATIADLCAGLGCSTRTARRYLYRLRDLGFGFEVQTMDGRAHRRVWRVALEPVALKEVNRG